jgi:uncharacterized protein (UPF0332 family)
MRLSTMQESELNDVYDRCIAEGYLTPQNEVDADRIKKNLSCAEENLATAKDALVKKQWTTCYKLHYDALHLLVDAFLAFDKVETSDHQCLFAFLSVHHEELELDWNFFEKIRAKIANMNEDGQIIAQEDWKTISLQMNLYILTMKKAVEEKIGNWKR